MSVLELLWRIVSRWYVAGLLVAAAGAVVGYFVLVGVYPGKPKIGVIDIPFTVLNENSSFVISAFLDYTRQNDDIKAVVIKLSSPGSTGVHGEQVYLETRELREEKPVVIAMGDIVASGAYLWSMGASYLYAKPGSWVGSVGAFIAFPFPSIPEVPDERVIRTGPQKFLGGSRRDFLRLLDQGKESFYQTVVAERGDKLLLSREDLLQAGIYNGNEGVRLGLVDAVGGETQAIEKAARLAGISRYDLVDVNVEVFRIFNEKFMRIREPLLPLLEASVGQPGAPEVRTLTALFGGSPDSGNPLDGVTSMDTLRRVFLPSGVDDVEEELFEFPVEITSPRIYYLYVGPSP